jgi:hypothetical protein
MRWVSVIAVLIASSPARAQAPGEVAAATPPLHRTGRLHLGLSGDAFIGAIQGITAHDYASGVVVGFAGQLDLDARCALRVVGDLGAGGFGHGGGYGELAVIPGALYRFRTKDDQTWVPYLGGGLRLGLTGVGYKLTDKPIPVACCHDWGGGGLGGGGHTDPYVDTDFTGLSPEAWGGIDLSIASWLSIQLAGALAYEHVESTRVFVLRETLALRVSI